MRDLGIHYTTRLGTVLDLKTGAVTASQSLVWSVRSAWRRVTSLAWNATLFRALRRRPLLRISIHPVDIRHAVVWNQIKRLTAQALKTRSCVTYEEWTAGGSATATKS